MKKLIIGLLLIFTMHSAFARDAIYKTTDGTVIKCTYKMTEGSIQQFATTKTFTYTFKNKKLYSRDLFNIFAAEWKKNYKKGTPNVLWLRIKKDIISFSEYVGVDTGTVSLKTKIDRKTGKLTFKAQKLYHWSSKTFYRKNAKGCGQCRIIK